MIFTKKMVETDKNLRTANLNDIKNKYIIQKLFDNIEKDKFLNIIRYNKNIQNKLDVDINIYKKYSQIIFEIKVFKNEGKLMLKTRRGGMI